MANNDGNQKRCRGCHRLAGKDGWCKIHRPKINQQINKEKYDLQRNNYKEYGGFINKDSFLDSGYGIQKDTFDINRGS